MLSGVLHGPYADKTLMRNVLGFGLAREGTGRYAPRARFCELYLNGQYEGVYVLMEKVSHGLQLPSLWIVPTAAVS